MVKYSIGFKSVVGLDVRGRVGEARQTRHQRRGGVGCAGEGVHSQEQAGNGRWLQELRVPPLLNKPQLAPSRAKVAGSPCKQWVATWVGLHKCNEMRVSM